MITRRDVVASFALLADVLAADAHVGAQTAPPSATPTPPRPPMEPEYWFAWSEFHPRTTIFEPPSR